MKKIFMFAVVFMFITTIFATDTSIIMDAKTATGLIQGLLPAGITVNDILAVLGAIYVAATALTYAFVAFAKLTKTPKDDEVAGKMNRFLLGAAKFFMRFGLDITKSGIPEVKPVEIVAKPVEVTEVKSEEKK